ncbi:putative transposase, partial [Streptomyces sp. di188]
MAEIIQKDGTWTFDGATLRLTPGRDKNVGLLRRTLGEVAVPLEALAGVSLEQGKKSGRLRLRLRDGADPLLHATGGRLTEPHDPYQLAVESDRYGVAEYFTEEVRTALLQLRRASRTVSRRQGPDRRTGQKPSRRWEKANAARDRVHHRVANLRADALHKLTTAVAAEYGTVVVEDLNVAGMLRNRRLARRIADAGFGEIRRQLTYKTRQRHATRTIAADRWYPSSKTCSGCGAVKAKLPPHVRTYQCDACHLVIDRDDNAALNLAALAAAATTGTGVAGDQDTQSVSKPRGADQKTRVTRPRRKAEAGRAGGATLPRQRQTEARDRTQ